MKAVLCKEYGGPERLVLEDVPSLVPKPNEVIIGVKACGLNFPDNLIIQGKYQFQPEFPFSPGGEVAGVVIAQGEDVRHVQEGDHVVAGTSWGGLAEEARSLASNVYKIPDNLEMEQAAGCLMTYGTAYHALVDRANLQAGESVLVLGASGGIGSASIQLAKLLGARVVACASTEDKLAYCRSLGADEVIHYTEVDLKTRIKELTDGKGVDIVVDPVGGKYTEEAFRGIARFGRYLVVGFAAGQIPKISLNLPLLKSASLVGVFWGSFFRNNPEENRKNVSQLMQWFGEGKLEVPIDKVFPLANFEMALNTLANKEVKGKIVLVT
ncbi:NADPH:quinone oxidoreductase [Reichenbachiella sp. 5M10]|uniref:NADPH:quinone oxidoreductase family protein n=1 Tax=Reichenbachiella sp. 5M10 TaxID=1889772 RepID=UPI000C14FF29|nr:NADPH:quinone oxidoreductase family protein [Reichenbachiella sp. 5M10]PIB34843.1 NADPH:quinone oxidoreductase [Reichenbachiella sp. 5M10]